MYTIHVSPSDSRIHLLGRLDPEQDPAALDWTGSGAEFLFKGSDLWAELEAPAPSPVFWMIVLADGCPVTRFPVEPGRRFYPLLLGMEKEQCRLISLLKETQCMPASPEATVFLHAFRVEGELLPPPERPLKIEFIGDSLTSGEGSLAPRGNEEWVTPWFSARGNYSWYACSLLNAEGHILSQSGYGVCWDWEHNPANNMSDGYELTAGVLSGPAAEQRGCRKPWNFASWQPDIVCIRLLSNDANGMKARSGGQEEKEYVTEGCLSLIRKVRKNNPTAKIVWILPGSDSFPEIGAEAVCKAQKELQGEIRFFTLPDYGPEDMGARSHPNAVWNRKAGILLADYLSAMLKK